MLLPGIREPDQPLSMGLNLRRRNLVMESLNLINLSILKRNTIFKKKSQNDRTVANLATSCAWFLIINVGIVQSVDV